MRFSISGNPIGVTVYSDSDTGLFYWSTAVHHRLRELLTIRSAWFWWHHYRADVGMHYIALEVPSKDPTFAELMKRAMCASP